jgi:predicted nucleic acid-binding protein
MISQPVRIVVDASVGVKLFVIESLSDAAHALFAHITLPGTRFYTPDLFYVECTNVLWKYARRGKMPIEDANAAVDQLCRLALHSVATVTLVSDALEIAQTYDVTAYDAVYAALARRENTPLVTADEALVRKLVGLDVVVLWLGDAQLGTPPPL